MVIHGNSSLGGSGMSTAGESAPAIALGDGTEKEEPKKTFTTEPDNDDDLFAYFNS